jgi:ATP-dependent Lhr-like helicase
LHRHASVTFVRRSELDWLLAAAHGDWSRFANQSFGRAADAQRQLPLELSEGARKVADLLGRRGASFFPEISAGTSLGAEAIEDALWELLARGLCSADAVESLRLLQSPKKRKQKGAGHGRWWLLEAQASYRRDELVEKLCFMFLRRYGIVWRDLVVREPLSPTWRELVMCYRRLEARGDIRGGRFVGGYVGEPYALPDAVDQARAVRREEPTAVPVRLAATDPLNLTGIVTPGSRISALPDRFVTYVAGIPQTETAVLPFAV